MKGVSGRLNILKKHFKLHFVQFSCIKRVTLNATEPKSSPAPSQSSQNFDAATALQYFSQIINPVRQNPLPANQAQPTPFRYTERSIFKEVFGLQSWNSIKRLRM